MIRTAIFWYAYVDAGCDGRSGDTDFYGRLWAISIAVDWSRGKPNYMNWKRYNNDIAMLKHDGVL